MATKGLRSFRIDKDVEAAAKWMARIEGISLSQLINDGLTNEIARRRNDPGFQQRLREQIARDEQLLQQITQGRNGESGE